MRTTLWALYINHWYYLFKYTDTKVIVLLCIYLYLCIANVFIPDDMFTVIVPIAEDKNCSQQHNDLVTL